MKKVFLFLVVVCIVLLSASFSFAVPVAVKGTIIYEGAPVKAIGVGCDYIGGSYQFFGNTVSAANGYFILNIDIPSSLSGQGIRCLQGGVPHLTGQKYFIFHSNQPVYDLGEIYVVHSSTYTDRTILIHGRITDENNSPVASALIKIKVPGSPASLAETVSSEDGWYSFTAGIPDYLDEYSLEAYHSGMGGSINTLIVTEESIYHEDIQMFFWENPTILEAKKE